MFIKKIDKGSNIKKYTYYRLCQSVHIGGKTRHNNLLSLGTLEGLDEEDRKNLANRIESLYLGTPVLFEVSEKVETLALDFYKALRNKNKQPKEEYIPDTTDFQRVDINSLEHEEGREVGAEWLCYQAASELDLPKYFKSLGWSEELINSVLVLIISRAVNPVSEYKTASWLEDNSFLSELIFKKHKRFSHTHLYKMGDLLYENRVNLIDHISLKTNELFNLTDKIVFFDLTNTYFEGVKADSKIAKFGRSKEKRKDAKLISLALVVNAEGFVKYSRVYEGNIFEGHTLLATVEALAKSSNAINPTIVFDAGLVTEKNLAMLREKGFHYLCVTRSKLKDYETVDLEKKPIVIQDKRGSNIEVKWVKVADCEDSFLHIKSDRKALKEASMNARFSERFEEELTQLSKTLLTPRGTKTIAKVYERLGRIKERYPRIVQYYTFEITDDKTNVTNISFSRKKAPEPKETDGVYFIRTSLPEKEETTIWTIYNTLTEIEATFRTLKTDLNLRPVFHQTDARCEAHINLGVIAYLLVNTIRHKLKCKGIHHSWQTIVSIMNTQKVIVSTVKTDKNELLLLKKCTRPNSKVLEIYNATQYKPIPFKPIKEVAPQNINRD